MRKEVDYAQGMVSKAVLGDFIEEMTHMLPKLNEKERELIEGTLLGDIVEDTNDIVEQGVMLFMDVVCDATTFARGSGGGGGSDNDWGRKKDEDDVSWAQRCAHMARHFVKAKKKVVQEPYRGLRR